MVEIGMKFKLLGNKQLLNANVLGKLVINLNIFKIAFIK